MAKRKPKIRMRTYGIYTQWESDSRTLPKISEVTTKVNAVVDVEFGFIVNVTGGKNQELYYCIDHPGILDDQGKRRPPFDGVVYIKKNDWDFYLGDTIWKPIHDKLGNWHMWLELDGKVVAEKTFELLAIED
ncbi:MAG: DUF3859 domain-containing protein [Planctomycetaceae bacterium]|nr:DUF3859 domain-containing protein [Planctomycetaceae bacterium]